PKEKATWVRNDLINLGLLSSEEDPDNILLNSSLGESSQDKDNKKLISTKKSIESQIKRGYPAVQQVDAQITLPKDGSIFSEEVPKGAATISLRMNAGRELSSSQVKGIQSMVSAAIEGVKTNEVTIVDTKRGVISGSENMSKEGTTARSEERRVGNE